MAKSKTIKNAPILKAVSETDFTFNTPCRAVIRFNSANVLDVLVNLEQLTISGTLYDEVNNKEYQVNGELTEKE